MKTLNDTKIWLLATLTLGLAPFVPEPHIWGKIKWIAGGAEGMQLMDWGDLLFHGTPWLLLIRALIVNYLSKKNPETTSSSGFSIFLISKDYCLYSFYFNLRSST